MRTEIYSVYGSSKDTIMLVARDDDQVMYVSQYTMPGDIRRALIDCGRPMVIDRDVSAIDMIQWDHVGRDAQTVYWDVIGSMYYMGGVVVMDGEVSYSMAGCVPARYDELVEGLRYISCYADYGEVR